MATKITEYLTPREAAELFRVCIRTLNRWDQAGLFPTGAVFRTPGGHRRYRAAALAAMLSGQARP